MIKKQIDADLKEAMLGGDKRLVSVLRTLKGVILDAEIAKNAREVGLPEDDVITLLQKESKKRGEAALLYEQNNDSERAQNERYEQTVLAEYLPKALDDNEIAAIIDDVMKTIDTPTMQQMGQIIGAVKAKAGAAADGAVVARLVKERLEK